jgi:hypothetical protein
MPRFTAEDEVAVRRAIQAGALQKAIEIHRAIFPWGDSPLIRDIDERDLHECLYSPAPVFSFCLDKDLRELRLRMATAVCLEIRADRRLLQTIAFPGRIRWLPGLQRSISSIQYSRTETCLAGRGSASFYPLRFSIRATAHAPRAGKQLANTFSKTYLSSHCTIAPISTPLVVGVSRLPRGLARLQAERGRQARPPSVKVERLTKRARGRKVFASRALPRFLYRFGK